MSTSYSVVVNGHTVAHGEEAELAIAMYWRGRQQGWHEAIDAALAVLQAEADHGWVGDPYDPFLASAATRCLERVRVLRDRPVQP